jgi:branched-chain amino acid transport system substrate-binding protein
MLAPVAAAGQVGPDMRALKIGTTGASVARGSMRNPVAHWRHALLAALAVAGCLWSIAAAAGGSGSPAPLLVAVQGPQSGSQAANGIDQLRGVRLAVKQLNAHGGLWDGRKVVVFAADDRGDAANAKPVARKVIAKGIRFVIGPYNSSVGIENLSLYRRSHVLPLWMTSRDETAGVGATVQPMNTQIAPIEDRYAKRLGARRVAMVVDDTKNGAFTKGMAERLRAALERDGASVSWTPVQETTDPRTKGNYYSDRVAEALRSSPDLVYVSTYFPEGIQIAKALAASGSTPRCLMGLANVDSGFVAKTTLAEAQRCVFSGVPAAAEMPSARTYVHQFRATFGKNPGVWGSFTYDSARILFAAIDRAKSYGLSSVERQLRATRRYSGATGIITIDPKTGYRTNVPVSILRVDSRKRFVIAK